MLSAGIVATLALGIGISSSVFTVVDAVALRAHVDRDRETYFHAFASYAVEGGSRGKWGQVSLPDFLALAQAHSVRDLSGYSQWLAGIGSGDATGTRLLLVTCGFFAVHPVGRPLVGRVLAQSDCDQANPVIVLSEGLWRTTFASDSAIVGKAILTNGQPLTVVGVAPFSTAEVWNARGWVPYTLDPLLRPGSDLVRGADTPWLRLEGHVSAGESRPAAAAEFSRILAQQDRLHPPRTTRVAVTDGSFVGDDIEGRNVALRLTLALLTAVAVIVVLVVCANVTTLLLSRAEARRREMGVRIAMGAGRMRLIRMLLTETVALAVVAGLASLYLTYRVPPLLVRYVADQTLALSLEPDWRVLTFMACMTMLAGVVSGLVPALQSLDLDLVSALKGGARKLNRAGRPRGARAGLVATQVTLSVVLVSGAVLFLRSSRQAAGLDTRMETRRVLALTLGGDTRGAAASWETFYTTLRLRLGTTAAAQAVGFAAVVPYQERAPVLELRVGDGVPSAVATDEVSPELLGTLGIPILRGRGLRGEDQPCETRHCPVVVSEAFVRRFAPTGDPVGLTLRTSSDTVLEVVGVARDVVSPYTGAVAEPMIYQPWVTGRAGYTTFVRVGGNDALVRRMIGETARGAFPGAFGVPQPLQREIDQRIADFWRIAQVISLLGVMAVGLVLLGIYGVVSFAVSQRTREIGVRLALGASASDVYRTVVSGMVRPIAIGMVVGLILAMPGVAALGRVVGDELPGIDWRDPTPYLLAIAVLGVVGAIATIVPARSALAVDPLMALREE